MKVNKITNWMQGSRQKDKIDWVPYCGGYVGSRLMPDGVCNFIYTILPNDNGGYFVDAINNACGTYRIAVKSYNHKTNEPSIFKCDIDKLKEQIEQCKILWKYISHCNCIGKITTYEY